MDNQPETTPLFFAETVTTLMGEAATAVPAAPAAVEPAAPEPAAENQQANKLLVIAKALKAIEQNLQNVIRLLEAETGSVSPSVMAGAPSFVAREFELMPGANDMAGGRVIEGVFDGLQMVGADGKTYSIPPNYASKSKLVEGDMLKLTITPKGSFIYKQIGPIERSRLVGSLGYDLTVGEYFVTQDNRRWSVLKASVTYFKGEPGDEAVILVPKSNPSKWAAVENVIRKNVL
ncbi:hypothetical protein HY633_03660 [Candidatus Uhrbacteria bacterium]|nr:hypothetical protein [Candidatus Uhrbacteria bacterium]